MDLDRYHTMVSTIMETLLGEKRSSLEILSKHMEALNPISVLRRGYASVSDKGARRISSVKDVEIDDDIDVAFQDGDLNCIVKNKKEVKRDG